MQSNFHKLVWVKCPKCTSKGVVKEIKTGRIETSFGIPYTHARFTCSNCDFQLNNLDKNNAVQEVWYSKRELGFVESNRCSACGVEGTIGLPKISFKGKELIDVLLKCSGCNQEREYQLLWERCDWFKAGVDKNFGLEFYYSKNIKGNNFWVLNAEHHSFIYNYLARPIRKTSTLHSSPENRLPKFIISNKNKEVILAYLAKIKTELK